MTRDDAYQLIRSLARSDFDFRGKGEFGDDDQPLWTPEICRADAEGEGRSDEAAAIGEAIGVLTLAEANRLYRAAWYQFLNAD